MDLLDEQPILCLVSDGGYMRRESRSEIFAKLGFGFKRASVIAGIALLVVICIVQCGVEGARAASSDAYPLAEKSSSNESAVEQSSEDHEAPCIYVHVDGAVSNPGLYALEQDSRIDDALQAAGGFAEDAATNSVNLAQKISDGMKITILTEEQWQSAQDSRQWGDGGAGNTTTMVNINTATSAQLQSLPGIGPSLASRIISDRERNGPFSHVYDIMRVSGIGQKKYEAIEALICV